MTTVAVIQERMGSTPLPGKVMIDIVARAMINRVVDRAREIDGVDEILVDTSTEPAEAPLGDNLPQHERACTPGAERYSSKPLP